MKFIKIILSIIIFFTFVLIGTPIEYNCIEFNLIIILVGTIFAVYKFIIKKEKVINNKIDLVVLAFYITPIIPLIFGRANSVEETLIALIRNISLFNIYYMLKNAIVTKDMDENWLTNVLIAGGVLLVLLGIDERLSRTIFQNIQYIGIPSITNIENRMFSTLGYANSFAIIMAIEVLLCCNRLKHNKVLFSGLIYLFLLGMMLSYSRSVIALFVLFVFVYIICTKRKYFITYNVFQNLVLTLFGMKMFEILSAGNQNILAWISIILGFILSVLIAKIISKNYKKLCKIKLKTYVKIMVLLMFLIVVVYFIGIQLKIPLKVFDYGEINPEIRYKLYDIKKETEYSFEFDLNTKVIENTKIPVYRIVIAEENKYYDTINTHEIKLSDFEGKEEIKFTTSNETVAIVIYVKSDFPRYQNGLTINSLYINNEKYGLNYAYIPVQLIERIESFSISHKSLWERFVYYKDASKIIKENILFGLGANGWLYNYEDIQTYKYSTTEVHNYALQIFIDNGIIGFLLLIIIIAYAIFKILKRKNITEIDIAFIVLTLHSMFDFDMCFYVIMVMWILLFILIIKKDESSEQKKVRVKLEKVLQILVISLNIAIICLGVFTYKIQKENEITLEKVSDLSKTDNFNQLIQKIREFNEYKKHEGLIYETLVVIDYENVETDNLQYIYELIKNKKIVVNTEYNMKRSRVIKKVVETTSNEKMLDKFCTLIIIENDVMVSNIKDKEKNRLTQEQINYYLEIQEELYNLACNAKALN